MPKTKSDTDNPAALSHVIVTGGLNPGWSFASVGVDGTVGNASEPFGSRPDCLAAAEAAYLDLQVRLDQ